MKEKTLSFTKRNILRLWEGKVGGNCENVNLTLTIEMVNYL